MKKGKFVVLEGGVGAGKSTQFEILKTKLRKKLEVLPRTWWNRFW